MAAEQNKISQLLQNNGFTDAHSIVFSWALISQ